MRLFIFIASLLFSGVLHGQATRVSLEAQAKSEGNSLILTTTSGGAVDWATLASNLSVSGGVLSVVQPTAQVPYGTGAGLTSETAFQYQTGTNRLFLTDGLVQLTNATAGTASTDGTLLTSGSLVFEITNQEAGYIQFGTSGSGRVQITSGGTFQPVVDDTYDAGGTATRWANLYAATIVAGDGTLEAQTLPGVFQANSAKATAAGTSVLRLKSNDANASSPLQATFQLRGNTSVGTRGLVIRAENGTGLDENIWLRGKNVGVGVDEASAAPVAKLEVLSAVAATSAPTVRIGNTTGNFDISPVSGSPEAVLTGAKGDMVSDVASGNVWAFEGTDGTNTGWVDLSGGGGETKLATVTGIDSKTVGTTNLYTVPSGVTAVITRAVVRTTTSTSITVPCTAGVGVASGEDDILDAEELTGLTSTGKAWVWHTGGLTVTAAATTIIKLGIDTAATGTSQTVAVDLFGYTF